MLTGKESRLLEFIYEIRRLSTDISVNFPDAHPKSMEIWKLCEEAKGLITNGGNDGSIEGSASEGED